MKTNGISFKATREEYELINHIIDRAEKLDPSIDRMEMSMDLSACHANGCPMDFQKLLDAPNFDFAHDLAGINRHIDRTTGELMDCFIPRCAKPQP